MGFAFDELRRFAASLRSPPMGGVRGRAVAQLAAILGLSPEETVCVGDGWNDISMLEAAGLGVAVRNAPEEVARHADVVLEYTNDEDAVAKVLERYFFGLDNQ